jgi:hypothetical protein
VGFVATLVTATVIVSGLAGLALALNVRHLATSTSRRLAKWRDAAFPIDSTPFTPTLARIWGFSLFTLAADAIAESVLPTTSKQIANAVLGPGFIVSWVLPFILNFRLFVELLRGSTRLGGPFGPRFRFAFVQLAAAIALAVLAIGIGAALGLASQAAAWRTTVDAMRGW